MRGLPKIQTADGTVCEVCMKGKQIRENIPKKSVWRASRGLELVHSDLCGPITPISESEKRYIINFIDDYSRKCWTFFLVEKSEAFKSFKDWRVAAERELGEQLVCLSSTRKCSTRKCSKTTARSTGSSGNSQLLTHRSTMGS